MLQCFRYIPIKVNRKSKKKKKGWNVKKDLKYDGPFVTVYLEKKKMFDRRQLSLDSSHDRRQKKREKFRK